MSRARKRRSGRFPRGKTPVLIRLPQSDEDNWPDGDPAVLVKLHGVPRIGETLSWEGTAYCVYAVVWDTDDASPLQGVPELHVERPPVGRGLGLYGDPAWTHGTV